VLLNQDQMRSDLSWAPVGYVEREDLAVCYEAGGAIKVSGCVVKESPDLGMYYQRDSIGV
jgi:hypothetical protein